MQISPFMPADELNRLDRYSYDPEKAKALLAEMNWDSTIPINTLTPAVAAGDPIQIVIMEMLKAVGIEVAPFTTTSLGDLFYGEVKDDWEMIIPPMGGMGPYADCTGFHIYPRWHSESPAPWQYYSNPRIDEIIDEVATLPIGPERIELCTEFDEMLTEELPGVALYYTVYLFAVNSRLHYGIPYGEQEHLERFDLWWIEP
jgi:peptide/nickel transport system substrate-binding protein